MPVERLGPGNWRVNGVGVGGLTEPDEVLDMGEYRNRHPSDDGDCRRPWLHQFFHRRCVLTVAADGPGLGTAEQMGARILSRDGGRPPLAVTGIFGTAGD